VSTRNINACKLDSEESVAVWVVFAHGKHSASMLGWLLGCCLVGGYHVFKAFPIRAAPYEQKL